MYLIVGTLVIVLLVLFYKWSVSGYQVFKERGILHEAPKPVLGNLSLDEFFGSAPHLQRQIDTHLKFQGCKIYGHFFLRDPVIVIRDAELIKNVTVKEFDHFMNHSGMEAMQTLLSKSLINLKDRKWKDMRQILSPTFTGSKMRTMYQLINACSDVGVQYIGQELELLGANSLDLEMKDFFTRFTNDVIASAAFGLKVNSFLEKENQFFTIGQKLTNFTGWAMLKAVILLILPWIAKVLPIQIMDEGIINYFKNLVFDAIKYRAKHKIVRPDMIHLLMEAQRQDVPVNDELGKKFSDDDLLAQCLLFFFAGFETVSSSLCFLTYELCINPEVQAKLYEEISAVEQQLQGQPLDYDTLMHMKYLDMVVSEGLRKWPPAPRTDRLCNADIDLRDENNEIVVSLKKGDKIFIPILATHYDPENFEQPEKFKPERFSEENKANIKPCTYMPFGMGPRSCIANRMALMEVKSMVYHLLSKFELRPAEKTVKDMMSSIVGFKMAPKEKFWLKYVPRQRVVD